MTAMNHFMKYVPAKEKKVVDLIGEYVLVRSNGSGCWGGVLLHRDGTECTLANARRLWRYHAAEGVSLSGVAAAGLHPQHLENCFIAAAVKFVIVLGVVEVLSTTAGARNSIEEQPARVEE